jgi:hypothetical protein
MAVPFLPGWWDNDATPLRVNRQQRQKVDEKTMVEIWLALFQRM